MTKKILAIILGGILLRLILMPLTFHPDLRGHYLGGYFIAKEGQLFSVYDYISRLPRDNPFVLMYQDNFLVYSPVTYWLHAAWLTIASPVIPWDIYNDFELHDSLVRNTPQFAQLLFVLKFPYLLADLICLWFVLKLVPAKNKTLAAGLWALNLPLIHSAFMMGQFDIFIVLGILAAVYFSSKKPVVAAICLALAAGFKPFPLFLIPFLPGKLWKNLTAGGLTYGAIIAPYLLTSPGYRMYALVAEHSDKIWYAKILVSGSQYLPLFFVGLVVAFWFKQYWPKALSTIHWLMVPLLIFYSVTHFHPQWFSWISGLLLLSFVENKASRPAIGILVLCYLIITFSFESSLTFGLFQINASLQPYLTDQWLSGVRAALAGTSLALVIKLVVGNYIERFRLIGKVHNV